MSKIEHTDKHSNLINYDKYYNKLKPKRTF